jgi:hypothetical protein
MELVKVWRGEGKNAKLLVKLQIRSVFKPKWNPQGYPRLGIVVPRSDSVFPSREDLEAYLQHLKEKYPQRGFKLLEKDRFLVLTQDSTRKTETGRVKRKKDYISLYFDLKNKEIYVPKSFFKERSYLHNFLLMVALSSLKLTTVEYSHAK